MTTLIRGGLVHDAVHRDACKADILLADGKIAAIGTDLTAPADAAVFDADGLDVFPGFVDAHTHIGLDGYGIGYECLQPRRFLHSVRCLVLLRVHSRP